MRFGGTLGAMRCFVRHSMSIVSFAAFVVIWLGGQAWPGHQPGAAA